MRFVTFEMLKVFQKLISKALPSGKPKDYESQIDALQSAKVKERMRLAKDPGTKKEVLYYLAEHDPSVKVRRAVVKNRSMPVHVSPVLARDREVDVRLELAARLADLLPELSEDKTSQLYAFVVQAMGTLALDEVLKVRLALSSTLKDHAYTPPEIAGKLARDVEQEVSEPILRFCAALSDEDILDILHKHPDPWVVEAIAGRKSVSAKVSAAVIDIEDRLGGKRLIENGGAQLTVPLLQKIVEKARQFPEWQKPISVRKALPSNLAKELAGFVEASVRDLLMLRGDFDEETTEEISAIFRRRLDFAADAVEADQEPVEVRLKRAIQDDVLDESMLSDAIGMRDYDFATGGVAHMAKVSFLDAKRVFDMQAPKAIVALCWSAGLSMRFALQVQKTIGQVQPREMIYPKGGSHYPLSEEELQWQLDFLGLQ